mmetsp:Transcript_13628/g.21334  ORF Transcript_13628/g.21334 Transcript_13628/m.21334 type:complete len:85 (-) Transcript_13628:1528-1782(-)
MAEKYKKQQEELKQQPPAADQSMRMSTTSTMNTSQVTEDSAVTGEDACPVHRRKLEIICITCKERICSNCALFGNHKNHDIRME